MNYNEYSRTNDAGATPVIPLPNPGEGGPVYPGNTSPNPPMPPMPPAAPMPPTPGEDTPTRPDNNRPDRPDNRPDRPDNRPDRPDNRPDRPDNRPDRPDNIYPVYPDNNTSGTIGTIITVLPRPVTSCFYCNSNSYGTIRFLNAAMGYNPFVISVNNRTAVDNLEYAEVSDYGRVSSGYQTITVSARNGYIYISKQIRITVGSTTTVAIVNTAGGLDLVEINDVPCRTPMGSSCVRVCNLSYNAGPLTVSTYSGKDVFQNVNFMETTPYNRMLPARYDIYIASTNEVLLSTEITVRSNAQYTIYLFNWNESPSAIRTLIIEDRK